MADIIMKQDRTTRRKTTQIIRRPWRQRITNDLDGGFAMQMFSHLAKDKSIHGRNAVDKAVAYVSGADDKDDE
jgi:hypothetical protein